MRAGTICLVSSRSTAKSDLLSLPWLMLQLGGYFLEVVVNLLEDIGNMNPGEIFGFFLSGFPTVNIGPSGDLGGV